jgi:Flp pilus assembly protein TadG
VRQQNSSKGERGQAIVEFAIVLPALALLLLGILQFGITFNHYLALTDAVRAGARTAAVSRYLGPGGAVSATKDAVVGAGGDLKITDSDVDVSSSWTPGEPVTVSAVFPYSINLLGLVVKSGNLTSTTQERVE